jgi:dipeptidyl aminopeptidase/acylaminoacyl peptidase
LLYTSVKNVTHQIGRLDIRSGAITILEKDFVMLWDQPILALTPDCSSFATIHTTSQQPSDVYLGTFTDTSDQPGGVTWSRLTRLNPLLEAALSQAKSERINYQSIDGWRIDGIFLPPLTAREDELPPLYVDVHGGPSGADCDGWRPLSLTIAAAGYAVFSPNMRGSWGHGAAFADAVLGDMGGKDLQDILNGIDYLVKQGKVDGQRVCIGGWSNGGFLSAWAITQTNRFKAAMVGAGIMDWLNMHAQTSIPDADQMLLAADPLVAPEVYLRNSPLTYAARVTTPTLILHGENDPYCPIAQAYAFYRALRERNVPVECVIYPREGHGVSERDHFRDAIARLLQWLEKYV